MNLFLPQSTLKDHRNKQFENLENLLLRFQIEEQTTAGC